jgi:hypothetical protein
MTEVTQGLVREDASLVPDSKPSRELTPAGYGQVYLELAAIDLDDERAMAAFVRRHGTLGVYAPAAVSWHDERGYFGFRGDSASEVVIDELWERRQKLRHHFEGWSDFETVREFRWGASMIRDMLTAWRIINGQLRERDAVWHSPCFADSNSPETPERPAYLADEPELAWPSPAHPPSDLERGMKSALNPFSPRINWIFDEELLEDPRFTPHGRVSEPVYLYSICALELFNHIATGATYRRCANRRCGQLFVHQEGRANHGQYRTRGVKYHHVRCGRADAQRRHRLRRKTAQIQGSVLDPP